jgi:hypothetical protein
MSKNQDSGTPSGIGVIKKAFSNRQQVHDAKEVPGRTGKALRSRPHGAVTDSSGNKDSAPKKHPTTVGQNSSGPDPTTQKGESYRKGEHANCKELEHGFDPREPKPKCPAAIDRDSSYESPSGPSTTKVKPK